MKPGQFVTLTLLRWATKLLSPGVVEKVVDKVVELCRRPRQCLLCSCCLFLRQLFEVPAPPSNRAMG